MAEPLEHHFAGDPTPCRLIPRLPDEISEQCIARMPLSSLQQLTLVSRSWRTLIRSPRIFKLRTKLRATETFVCINICTPADQSRWYLLIRDHHGIPSRLMIIPPTPIPTFDSAFTSLGHSLYVIGGSSNFVQILDACLRTWTTVPMMGLPRQLAVAGAIGGRIYIFGGCLPSSDSWAEVFAPESGEWSPVPSPPHLRVQRMCASVTYAGVLMAMAPGGGGVVFNPVGTQAWRSLEFECNMEGAAMTVVDGYIYSNYMAGLRGFDPARNIWMPVEGLEGAKRELQSYLDEAVMTNLGGLLCVVRMGSEKQIQFFGIKVTKSSPSGFQGSIQWLQSTLVAFSEYASLRGCVTLEF